MRFATFYTKIHYCFHNSLSQFTVPSHVPICGNLKSFSY